jgi:hypothetical protein
MNTDQHGWLKDKRAHLAHCEPSFVVDPHRRKAQPRSAQQSRTPQPSVFIRVHPWIIFLSHQGCANGVSSILLAVALLSLIAVPAAAQFCAGDCNLDGSVTIDEVVIGVNIALGGRNRHDCPPADTNNDNTVTIDELIQSVRYALEGCPSEP